MLIDLSNVGLEAFIEAIFGATAAVALAREAQDPDDWLEFKVDPRHQVVLLADLFRHAGQLHDPGRSSDEDSHHRDVRDRRPDRGVHPLP